VSIALPEHLPREVETHMPAAQDCAACGAELINLEFAVALYVGGIALEIGQATRR
jgi:hypothetical protein